MSVHSAVVEANSLVLAFILVRSPSSFMNITSLSSFRDEELELRVFCVFIYTKNAILESGVKVLQPNKMVESSSSWVDVMDEVC